MITTSRLLLLLFLLPSSSLAFVVYPGCQQQQQQQQQKTSTALEYGQSGDETARKDHVRIGQHKDAVTLVKNKNKKGEDHQINKKKKKKQQQHEVLDMCTGVLEKQLDDFLLDPATKSPWKLEDPY